MTFWILAGLMAAFCVAMLLVPLIRRPATSGDGAAYDLEIYKAQLVEIERDLARGEVGEAEAAAARVEIGRRLLAADQSQRQSRDAPGKASRFRWVWPVGLGTSLVLPVLGVVLYLDLGRPDIPARPFAGREAERAAQASQGAEIAALRRQAASLEQALTGAPGNLADWLRLADMLMALEEYGRAANAYAQARAFAPEDAEILASQAEAIIAGSQGSVGEQAQELLNLALQRDPRNLRAHFYLGDADWQAGRRERALERWAELRRTGPADAPWQGVVEARIRRAAAEMGADAAPYLPEPQPVQARGPSAADIEAAEGMSAEDRNAMIAGMVDNLAARLDQAPDDIEGWLRLIRSYTMLGRQEEALEAAGRGLGAFDGRQEETGRLVALSRELGLTGDTLPVGPSVARLDEARDKPLAERRTLLADDTAELTAWLAGNPDALQGWVRLAHIQRLLEEPVAERDALLQATRLAPDNVALWRALGRAAFEADGQKIGPDALAAMHQVTQLQPNDLEANWMLALSGLAAGDRETARLHFERGLSGLPKESPEYGQLRAEADRLLQGE